MSKIYFPVRFEPAMIDKLDEYAKKMGRTRTDTVLDAVRAGLIVLDCPEYYHARLNGRTDTQIRDAIKKALTELTKGKK